MLHIRRLCLALVCAGVLAGSVAWAGGPRWVTGLPYFSQATAGQPVVWYTNHPVYFTDAGDLSATVNHAAADALVAAAAAVWNTPTSALSLAQGGVLAEHVSGANAYVGNAGVVFPADVLPANYLAIQIAVVYDSDGSVTDMMLGAGASVPSGCRQNAVTESVDSIAPTGFIQHAVLVLNGRCTGGDPAQQTQMQYQLMRAFGRVLGLGWSQTNDNVFTGTPQPTYQQAMHWPVMHPIDIICGPYTYQCMPQPFVLRDDDLSALAELYPIAQGQAGPGQVDTLLNASEIGGQLSFPNGQGMQGVNVLGRRLQQYYDVPEAWYSVSSVSGELYRRSNGNPVSGTDSSMSGSMGEGVGLPGGVLCVLASSTHLGRLAEHHLRDRANQPAVYRRALGGSVYGVHGGAFGERSDVADGNFSELCGLSVDGFLADWSDGDVQQRWRWDGGSSSRNGGLRVVDQCALRLWPCGVDVDGDAGRAESDD